VTVKNIEFLPSRYMRNELTARAKERSSSSTTLKHHQQQNNIIKIQQKLNVKNVTTI